MFICVSKLLLRIGHIFIIAHNIQCRQPKNRITMKQQPEKVLKLKKFYCLYTMIKLNSLWNINSKRRMNKKHRSALFIV